MRQVKCLARGQPRSSRSANARKCARYRTDTGSCFEPVCTEHGDLRVSHSVSSIALERARGGGIVGGPPPQVAVEFTVVVRTQWGKADWLGAGWQGAAGVKADHAPGDP